MVAPVAVATVAVTVEAEEVTEPLHQAEDDRFSSTMFVLPSTYLSLRDSVVTNSFDTAPLHRWLAGYEGPVPSSRYVLLVY